MARPAFTQSSSTCFVVTGAAGFIGSNICDYLLNQGYTVVGIDNFDPMYARTIKESNLQVARTHSRFHFYEIDLSTSTELDEILSLFQPQAVLHMAARAGIRPSIQDPTGYAEFNYVATVRLLEAMNRAGIMNLVFASSSSVYGGNKTIPFSEQQSVDRPISPYAATKKACEVLNHVFHTLNGLSVINLRFFTVYGPRQRPDLAIHKFTRMIDTGVPLTLYGDGSSQRDYTYIDDILDGVVRSLERLSTASEPLFETYNLGEARSIKLLELVRLIETAVGKPARIEWLPPQPGDMPATYADIALAQSILGYDPQVDISEGIPRFVDWYKAHRNLLVNAPKNARAERVG